MENDTNNAVLYQILIRVEKKLDDHVEHEERESKAREERIRTLENNQSRTAGFAGAIGGLLTFFGTWILRILGDQ